MEMIRELRSEKPHNVVLFPADESSEPNDSAASSGVALLVEFVHSNYHNDNVLYTISIFA